MTDELGLEGWRAWVKQTEGGSRDCYYYTRAVVVVSYHEMRSGGLKCKVIVEVWVRKSREEFKHMTLESPVL